MTESDRKDSPDDRDIHTGYSEGNQRIESIDDAHVGSSPKKQRSAGDDLEGNEVSGTGEGKQAGDTSGIGEQGGRGNTNTGGFGVDDQIRPNPDLKRT